MSSTGSFGLAAAPIVGDVDGHEPANRTTGLVEAIDAMPVIGEYELERVALPNGRRDVRSVLEAADVGHALDALRATADCAVLEIDGRRRIRRRSTHFDTADLAFYRAALQRRPGRTKVRTRHFPDADRAFVEVATSDRSGRRSVRRIEIDPDHHDRLDIDACRFVDAVLAEIGLARRLRPTARTSSLRSTIVDRSDGSRATLGLDYRCEELRSGRDPRTSTLDGVIVEATFGSTWSPLDEQLRGRGVRPGRIVRDAGVSLALRVGRG